MGDQHDDLSLRSKRLWVVWNIASGGASGKWIIWGRVWSLGWRLWRARDVAP